MAVNKKGLYTNSELVDTIIVDLNNIIKETVNGQYIQACTIITQTAQKLINLRTAIDNDLKSKDKTIDDLKAALRRAGVEVIDIPAAELIKEKGGETDGK